MSFKLYSFAEFYWIAYQLALAVLCLWIAVVVFRQRTMATWMALIGAVALPLFMIGSRVAMHFTLTTGNPSPPNLSLVCSLGHTVAMLSFLIGILLHLQRRKLEADRIADLEAILEDQRKDPTAGVP